MNRKAIYIIILLLTTAIFFSGCSALRATDTAKAALEDYYEFFNDEELDECIEMLGDEIIDDLGGDDDTETIYYSKRYLLGEVEEFKVNSFDSNGVFGEVTVAFEVTTKYENCDELVDEEYIIQVSGDNAEIIGYDLGQEPVPDQMIKEYFENYTNMQKAKNMYIPYVINTEGLFDEKSIQAQADYAYASGGEYKDHDITDYYYYYQKLNWDDDIYYILQIDADMEFEDEDYILYAEVSKQGDIAKFNYLEYYPKSAYGIVEKYYGNLKRGDTRAILNMYAPGFFEISTVTADEWEESILKVYSSGYGELVDYSITSWEYATIPFNDKEIEVYGFYVSVEFNDGVFDEYILVEKNESERAIVGHQIN